jgi:hypothetical protein
VCFSRKRCLRIFHIVTAVAAYFQRLWVIENSTRKRHP